MQLYEDLVRRALAATARSAELQGDSERVLALVSTVRAAAAGDRLLRRCAWCGRFEFGGEWLHLEAVGSGQQRVTASLREHATHGICEECFARESRR